VTGLTPADGPFTGLSAFPLTPMSGAGVDESAVVRLVGRLRDARVDSVGALGSTGSAAYLTREQRARVAGIAVRHAGPVPVIVGISAVSTAEVLRLAEDAQNAGASAVLLAPVSYQPLADDEVLGLYEDVTHDLSVPLCVYDNPTTTRFAFSDELHGAIAALPRVGSIKIPAVPADPDEARARVERLRALIPEHVTIGVSGDAAGVRGLMAGCDGWYSSLAGTVPGPFVALARAARAGDVEGARRESAQLAVVWDLLARFGGLRVSAAIAEELGLIRAPSLPRPLHGVPEVDRLPLRAALRGLTPPDAGSAG
jgi:4-hydroxy-tetrahydrodipicolinate synthase